MLPIILVLLVATSALANSGNVNLIQVRDEDRRVIDNSPIQRAIVINEGEMSANILNAKETIRDLYGIQSPSTSSGKAQAIGQIIALLGELSTGRPGDACAAANLINAYVRYANTGNKAGVREALKLYAQKLISSIDSLDRLVSNPEAARYAVADLLCKVGTREVCRISGIAVGTTAVPDILPNSNARAALYSGYKGTIGFRGGCAGEGRSYQFNAAWEYIIGSASRDQSRVINEQYCVARRLYGAIDARNNNVGATVTAAALPPSVQLFKLTAGPLSNFLNRLAANFDVGPAAYAAKQALYNAVYRVILN